MMTALVAWLICLIVLGFAVALIIPVVRFFCGMLYQLYKWAVGSLCLAKQGIFYRKIKELPKQPYSKRRVFSVCKNMPSWEYTGLLLSILRQDSEFLNMGE